MTRPTRQVPHSGFAPLVATSDSRGKRYVLDGRPVDNGASLEILLEGGVTHEVRIEGLPDQLTCILGVRDDGSELQLPLPANPTFRWLWPDAR